MQPETLRDLLEGGAGRVRDVAAAIDNPALMAAKGWDLRDWEYVQAPGMILFRRLDRPLPERPPEVVAAVLVVNAPESQRSTFEREALEGADGRYPVEVAIAPEP